jgi:hypothetical protein
VSFTFKISRRLKTIFPKISIDTSKTGGTGLKIFLETAVQRKGFTVSINKEDPWVFESFSNPGVGVRKMYACEVRTVKSKWRDISFDRMSWDRTSMVLISV